VADPYQSVRDHFRTVPEVEIAEGRGAQGLKLGKKMFAMFYKGELLVKLPPHRVNELVALGRARPYDPGTGTPMKDRALIPASEERSWIALCEEALGHAR
jgi:hypothetical protein